MLLFSCHICFRSTFMSDNPHFYYWLYLLPVVLLAYWIISLRQGKVTPKGSSPIFPC